MDDIHRASDQFPSMLTELSPSSNEIETRSSARDMATRLSGDTPIDHKESDNSLYQIGYLKQESNDVGIRFQEYKERKRKMELVLLDHFAELYTERRELFKKIFPGPQNELTDVLKKVDEEITLKKMTGSSKATAMSRSLSVGSPRTPGGNGRNEDTPRRLDRMLLVCSLLQLKRNWPVTIEMIRRLPGEDMQLGRQEDQWNLKLELLDVRVLNKYTDCLETRFKKTTVAGVKGGIEGQICLLGDGLC